MNPQEGRAAAFMSALTTMQKEVVAEAKIWAGRYAEYHALLTKRSQHCRLAAECLGLVLHQHCNLPKDLANLIATRYVATTAVQAIWGLDPEPDWVPDYERDLDTIRNQAKAVAPKRYGKDDYDLDCGCGHH